MKSTPDDLTSASLTPFVLGMTLLYLDTDAYIGARPHGSAL
jgi:hypothetical protein